VRSHRIGSLLVGAVVAVSVIVAGCGAAATPGPTDAPSATLSPTAASPTAPEPTETRGGVTPTPSGPVVVVAIASGTVGTYLAGADGRALYTLIYDPDNGSTCNLTCAETWPPFVPGAGVTVVAGDGVTGELATFARADGSRQLSYRGRPLYYYSGDRQAGEATGDGNGSVWSVARP
jgi:predicted lipoprotein with Yx(FWY)xxD motif